MKDGQWKNRGFRFPASTSIAWPIATASSGRAWGYGRPNQMGKNRSAAASATISHSHCVGVTAAPTDGADCTGKRRALPRGAGSRRVEADALPPFGVERLRPDVQHAHRLVGGVAAAHHLEEHAEVRAEAIDEYL